MMIIIQCLNINIIELTDAIQQSRKKVVDLWFIKINRSLYAHSKDHVDNSELVRTCNSYKYHTQLQDESIEDALVTTEARLFF